MKQLGLYFASHGDGYSESDKKKYIRQHKELEDENVEVVTCNTIDDVDSFVKNPDYYKLIVFCPDKNFNRTKEFRQLMDCLIDDEQQIKICYTNLNRNNS